jgi:hypothetical protein
MNSKFLSSRMISEMQVMLLQEYEILLFKYISELIAIAKNRKMDLHQMFRMYDKNSSGII